MLLCYLYLIIYIRYKMKVEVTQDTSWKRALNEARRTCGKKAIDKEPSDEWKAMSIMAEHSQIKLVEYTISFSDLKQWVGVHLLRHGFMLPFIHSQRSDRREDINELADKYISIVSDDIKSSPDFNVRDYLPQGIGNDQDFVVNVQTLINISRKRLCMCASKETREAWQAVKDAIAEIDPIVAKCMVKNCVYRGRCPEMHTCGYYKTEKFNKEVDDYWSLIGR